MNGQFNVDIFFMFNIKLLTDKKNKMKKKSA